MLIRLLNKKASLLKKRYGFKTIHEYFNILWKEHSSEKTYLKYPSLKRISNGLNATNLMHIDAYSVNSSDSMFVRKTKKLVKLRRIPRINNIFKLALSPRAASTRTRSMLQIISNSRISYPVHQLYLRPRVRQANPYWHSINMLSIRKKLLKFRKRKKRSKSTNKSTSNLINKRLLQNSINRQPKNIKSTKINDNRGVPQLYKVSLASKLGMRVSGIYRLIPSIKNIPANTLRAVNLRWALANYKFKKYRRFYRFKRKKLLKKQVFINVLHRKIPRSLNTKLNYKTFVNSYEVNKLKADITYPTFLLNKTSIKIVNSIANFSINYLSLFLSFKLTITNLTFTTEKFLIRKTLFSFLKRNEVKKSIMERRRKIKAFRFYKKVDSASNNKLFHKVGSYHPFYLSKVNSLRSNPFLPKITDIKSNDSKELFLPRIKFKPGYQRLWRQARSAIADNIGLRYTYQKQMTKHVAKLSKKINFYSFSMNESSIDKAILYSRLLPDAKVVKDFSKLRLISVNGWTVVSLAQFTIPGDIIQLTINKWLSLYFRWLVTWSTFNKNKFKTLVFRKSRASTYRLMKQRKQRSSHVPSWVHNSRFDMSDIKPNFEVDYFTMSSIVLYEPLLIDYYTPDDMPDHRHYIYRLYNWKYIT